MILDRRCSYNPNTALGELESVVVYYYHDFSKMAVPFHITKTEYAKLNGGSGRCYGRTPWGPFCWLKIYEYRVVSFYIERDPNKLKEIHENLYS